MKHLAIFDKGDVIEKILRGEKIIDGRFSRKKTLPYENIKKGDEILLKESGGPIVGKAEVDNVLFFDHLAPDLMGKLRKEYEKDLAMEESFWKTVTKCKYVSLIFLKNPSRFISPLKYKKHDRRSWVIISDKY